MSEHTKRMDVKPCEICGSNWVVCFKGWESERDRLIKETFALSEDRDAWKQKAEGLEGALRKVESWTCADYAHIYEIAKAALEEYGEGK